MSDLVSVHVNSKKLKRFLGGSNITVYPGLKEVNGIPIKIAFNTKQHFKKFMSKLHSGKGFVLNHDNINEIYQGGDEDDDEDDQASIEGGDILKSMKRQFNRAVQETKGLAKQTEGLATSAISKVKGGAIKNKAINKGLKNAARITEKAFKQATKAITKEAKHVYKNNKGALKDLAKDVVKAGLDSANGETDFDSFKAVTKKAAQNAKHIAIKDSLSRNGIMDGDNYRYGQFKNPEILPAVESGAGIYKRGGFNDVHSTYINPKPIPRTMGGSMKPLGGSFRKLGGSVLLMK